MCDETTDRELEDWLQRQPMTRRSFTIGGAATVAASSILAACATSETGAAALKERKVLITTPEGEADAVFVHPSKGKHAGVIMWPDVHGVRPAIFDMARRLAASGYGVLAVNPYYRTMRGRLFPEGESIRDPGGRERVTPHRSALSTETVITDARALTDWLDQQDSVDTSRGVGAVGFCMTGSWTLRAAAAVPDRIRAPVSFHGGGLATEELDSPHLLARQISGGVLIAIAENDHKRYPEAKDKLISAFATANVPAEVEVYEDAMHGWVPPDSRAHNPEQADRAWARMIALFEQQLA